MIVLAIENPRNGDDSFGFAKSPHAQEQCGKRHQEGGHHFHTIHNVNLSG